MRDDAKIGDRAVSAASAFRSALVSIALAACVSAPPVDGAPEAVTGPDVIIDPDTSAGAATVPLVLDDDTRAEDCTGTFIGRHHLLTAAHCATTPILDTTDRFVAHLTYAGVRADQCTIHPGAFFMVDTCDQAATTGQNPNLVQGANDLLVLRFSTQTAPATRSLAPPRSCFASDRVSANVRGNGPAGLGPHPRRRMPGVTNPAAGFADEIRIDTSVLDFFQHGDSGGPWTEAWRDAARGTPAPIFAITSGGGLPSDVEVDAGDVGGLDAGTRTAAAHGPFIWNAPVDGMRHVDWIWNLIRDDGSRCVLGPTPPATAPIPWPRELPCFVDGELRADADGDGIPDERDLCPRFDGRRRDAHMTTGVWANHVDTDDDFVGDDCDEYPGECNYHNDDDHDGVPGDRDNCPTVYNPGQAQCDPTPGAPGDACIDDLDRDGRPDRPACDNCAPDPDDDPLFWRASYNPDQRNCNADSELASHAPPLGDMCDPTPCGDTVLTTRDINHVSPFDPRATFRVQDQILIDTRSVVDQHARSGVRYCRCDLALHDSIDARQQCARAARTRPCIIDFHEYERPEVDRLSVWRRTSLAYSQCDGADCRFAGVGGPAATDLEMPSRYSPPSRSTVGTACRVDGDCPIDVPCIRAAGAAVGRCIGPSFTPNLVATWEIDQDRARWEPIYHDETTRPPNVPAACSTGSGGGCPGGQTCVDGSCVTAGICASDSACGAGSHCDMTQHRCVAYRLCVTDFDCLSGDVCRGGVCGTGTCTTTTDCPAGDLCTAGHCLTTSCVTDSDCGPGSVCSTGTSGGTCAEAPAQAAILWTHTPGFPTAGAQFSDALRTLTSHYWSGAILYPRFLYVTPLPACSTYLAPFLGQTLMPEADARGGFPTSFVALGGTPTSGGGCSFSTDPLPPFVDVRGALLNASAIFTTLPIGSQALRWVPASEPDEWLTAASVRYVALDGAGTAVNVASLALGGFVERTPCGSSGCAKPEPCNNPNLCPALTIDPPPEPGLPVLSATQATLFHVGVTDGAHARTIDAVSLDGVEVTQVSLGDELLGTVLAATFSPARRALYVLDDQTTPPHHRDEHGRGDDHDDGHHGAEVVVRLLSIDVTTGQFVELARWRAPRRASYALAEDPMGFLFLAIGRGDDHAVLWIEPGDTSVSLLGMVNGAGQLATPYMRAGEIGVSLAVGRGQHAHVVGYRPHDMRAMGHRRSLVDCF